MFKRLSWVAMSGILGLSAMSMVAQDGQVGGRVGRGGMGVPVQGVVTAISGQSITVKDESGTVWTIDTTANTRVTKERQPVKLTDVTAGQAVFAMGMPEPGKKEIHAMFISLLTPEQAVAISERAKEMHDNLGKTYILGKVTRIDETKITVMRADKVEQVVAVDENTLLRRGGNPGVGGSVRTGRRGGEGAAENTGEPITLADLKVGDNIAGPGAMKDGVLLLKELHVVVRRGPRGEGAPPSASPMNQ